MFYTLYLKSSLVNYMYFGGQYLSRQKFKVGSIDHKQIWY